MTRIAPTTTTEEGDAALAEALEYTLVRDALSSTTQ
jgi:hypothetical protein